MHNKMIARHQIAPKGDFMPEKLWGFRAEEEQAAAWKGSRPGEPGSHLQSSVKTFFPFILSIRNCLQCQQSWSMLPRNKKIFKFKVAFFPYMYPQKYMKGPFVFFFFDNMRLWWVGPAFPWQVFGGDLRSRPRESASLWVQWGIGNHWLWGNSSQTLWGSAPTLLRLCPNL